MDQEAVTTEKFLALVPADKFDWKPHAKSMTLRSLATHLAELPGWVAMVLQTSELDFAANPYTQPDLTTNAALLTYFGQSLAAGRSALEAATETDLQPDWALRIGDQILSKSSKYEMIRISYSQIVHHRAQLGVYLRLLHIPIPGSYGPSADEMGL